MSKPPSTSELSDAAGFAATRWTLVLAAARGNVTPRAAEAMAELCRVYWYPLYAYVRRRGHDTHEAEDLTQEFFLRLLAKNYLTGIDREKGKFRAFLLAAFKHFLANEWDRSQARKTRRRKNPLADQHGRRRESLSPRTVARLDAGKTVRAALGIDGLGQRLWPGCNWHSRSRASSRSSIG